MSYAVSRTLKSNGGSSCYCIHLLQALKADFELRGKASLQNLSRLKRADNGFGNISP